MGVEIEICVEEKVAMQKFRQVVADLNEDDETLLRFLKARDMDLNKAEEMLRKSMKWREENKVSSYVDWEPPKALAEDFLVHYIGRDNEGFPVIYVPLGRWNIRDRMEEGYLEETYNFRFYLLESILQDAIKRAGKSQLVLIIDTATLNFHKVAHMHTMNMVIKCCQDFDANYPERLKAAFCVNAVWVFPYAFGLVKPWLAPKTLAKVQVFDTNKSKWLPVITKNIPIEILPKQLLS